MEISGGMNMENYEWKEMKELSLKLDIAEQLIEDAAEGSVYRERIHSAGLCKKHPSYCTVCSYYERHPEGEE